MSIKLTRNIILTILIQIIILSNFITKAYAADTTAPLILLVFDDGAYTVSTTQLHAYWYSFDPESGIAEYKYAIGTNYNGTDILDWKSAGTDTEVVETDLDLANGQKYYFSVKAINGEGLSTFSTTDGITVDTSLAISPMVIDDGRYTNSTTELHAYWIPQTLETEIIEYQYSVGTEPGAINTVSWRSIGTDTEITRTDVYLEHGQTYYFNVKAKNINGAWSAIGSSDGIIIDANLPEIYDITPAHDSTFFTGTEVVIDVYATDDDGDSLEYQFLVDDEIEQNWTAFSTYDWIALPTTTDIRKITGKVRDDKGGITSEDVYYNVQINISDSTPPTTPIVYTNEYSDSLEHLYASWSSDDPDSGIAEFQYAIGTTSGGTDVVDWISADTNTTIIHQGLSLIEGLKYFFSVKATNGAGLTSPYGYGLGSYAAPKVDLKITSPYDGALITENEFIITGIAEGTDEVFINDKRVTVNSDDTFTGPTLIAPGYAARQGITGSDPNYIIMSYPGSTDITIEAYKKSKTIEVHCYQVFAKSTCQIFGSTLYYVETWNNNTMVESPFADWTQFDFNSRLSPGSYQNWPFFTHCLMNGFEEVIDYEYGIRSKWGYDPKMTIHTLPIINGKIQPMVFVFKSCQFANDAFGYYDINLDFPEYKVNDQSLKMLYGTPNYYYSACYVVLDNYEPDSDLELQITMPTYHFTFYGGNTEVFCKWFCFSELDILQVDLDIDGVSEEYEEHVPGKIISLTREGDGEDLDDLAKITLDISPSLTEGSLKLQALRGGSRIKVWEDEEKEIPVNLSQDNYLGNVPKTLYVDGIEKGEAVLELVYKDENGNQVISDKVAILVTETVSWSPAKGKTAYTWEPCYEEFNKDDYTKAFIDEVEKQGWEVFRYIDNSYDDDVELCTLENYKKVCNTGMLYVITHGYVSMSTAVYAKSGDILREWYKDPETGDKEPGMILRYDSDKFHYYMEVETSWLANNWAPTLNENKAIVHWYSCHSAENLVGFPSIMDVAGGRWRIGYEGGPYLSDCDGVNKKFFRRMNGTDDNGQKRTAGQAWDNGVGYIFIDWKGNYVFRVRMHGNDWTTLCPAPMADNAIYPGFQPGNKGYGCVIFDTYMNDTIPADDALVNTSYGPTLNHRWDGRAEGKFILGFNYDDTWGVWTEMRVVGNRCRSKDEYPEIGRAMDATRIAPNSTDEVPENFEWSY